MLNSKNLFGGMLRSIRIQRGRTMLDLATFMNVTVPYISDIERGRRNPPSPERIRALAQFLDAPGEADHLIELAIADRGHLSLSAKTELARALLVALDKRIENGSLDEELIRRLREVLDEPTR